MKLKRSKQIAVRLTKPELHNLEAYCSHNRLTRSKAIQQIVDRISAQVELKLPKAAYHQPENPDKSLIESNAEVISNVDILYRKADANYQQSRLVNRNIVNVKRQLNSGKFSKYNSQYLEQALKLVSKQVKLNIANDHYIYICLDGVEKGLKLK